MKKAALALIEHDGKFLCISRKESPSKIGLIGGKVEKMESLETALVREVKEEVGLNIDSVKPIFSEVVEDFEVHTFLVSVKSLRDLKPEKGYRLFWLSEHELISKSKWPDYNLKVMKSWNKIKP